MGRGLAGATASITHRRQPTPGSAATSRAGRRLFDASQRHASRRDRVMVFVPAISRKRSGAARSTAVVPIWCQSPGLDCSTALRSKKLLTAQVGRRHDFLVPEECDMKRVALLGVLAFLFSFALVACSSDDSATPFGGASTTSTTSGAGTGSGVTTSTTSATSTSSGTTVTSGSGGSAGANGSGGSGGVGSGGGSTGAGGGAAGSGVGGSAGGATDGGRPGDASTSSMTNFFVSSDTSTTRQPGGLWVPTNVASDSPWRRAGSQDVARVL